MANENDNNEDLTPKENEWMNAPMGRSSVQRAGRPFRRSREAMIIDMLLLPLGLIRSLVIQGVPGTWRELRRLPQTYARGWRESFWFFWPTMK